MPTATATTRRADPPPAVLKRRRNVAEDRLAIDRRLAKQYAEIDKLDAELKKIAGDCGASYKEDFGARGNVSVSPAHAAEFKGNVPVIVTEHWLGLTDAKREQLVKSGLIVIEAQHGKAFGGRVTVKVL